MAQERQLSCEIIPLIFEERGVGLQACQGHYCPPSPLSPSPSLVDSLYLECNTLQVSQETGDSNFIQRWALGVFFALSRRKREAYNGKHESVIAQK